MSGIPVLYAEGCGIAETWENSLKELYKKGCDLKTEYDKPGDPPSKDATMILTIHEPLVEPMIHRDLPGGFEELQEYVMEVCDGIKDHLIRDPNDPKDTRWQYTYHQRLFGYEVPMSGTRLSEKYDQIEAIAVKLSKSLHSRRAQAITWKVWEDSTCDDPACLQSIWCRVMPDEYGRLVLSMNVRFRSNDAYKAAFMNIFALVRLQERIALRISQLIGSDVHMGRYCHIADSYHIYGSNLEEFQGRFLRALEKRTFEQRTMRYDGVREIMDESIPAILDKAKNMAR